MELDSLKSKSVISGVEKVKVLVPYMLVINYWTGKSEEL